MTDDENNSKLNRRRVLGGIVTIGAASAAAGAGTFAYFSDTENSSGNTVEAGTLDLDTIADGQMSVTDLAPGQTVPSNTFSTTYSGSVSAEIDIDVRIAESSEPNEPSSNNNDLSATNFASKLVVTTATASVGGSTEDLTATASDSDGDGTITLDELVGSAPYDTVTGSNAASGDTVSLELDLAFPTSVGNSAQADGVDITVEFTAQQPAAD